MGLREDALKRILSQDAGRSAQLSLRLAQEQMQAHSGAVLAIEDGRYVLFAATELERRDLERIAAGWDRGRARLLAGRVQTGEDWALAPVGRPVAGLLYLGAAAAPIAPELLAELVVQLGPLFEIALSVRDQEPESRLLYETLVRHVPLKHLAKEKLLLVLRANEWNKSRAARALGTTRATLYKWMRKHGIAIEEETA